MRAQAIKHPSLGSTNAPLALVEFTDFECPFCIRLQTETFPLKAYVETGQLRLFSRNPAMSFHAQAEPAARAATCAASIRSMVPATS
jgi:protein-disulfide isomerase